MKKGSITVFSALVFMMIASVLFALLEEGRLVHLNTYADMTTELAIESVCAEYQPGLWQDYHLLCLDGAYGGEQFAIDSVTAVLGTRIRTNLGLEGDGSGMLGMELSAVESAGYQLLTDESGSVFLNCVSAYMKENLPIEAAQILYDRYTQAETVENSQDTETSVESAQTAVEQAKKEQQEQEGEQQSQAGNSASDGENTVQAGEVEENPLELVLELKQKALLGMVTADPGAISTKKIDLTDAVGVRNLETGTLQTTAETEWYERILTLEYLDEYFSDYLTASSDHALSYELEYVLCGKATDQANLEGSVQRLLLVREAANVTHILSDRKMTGEALALAELLAGFTGNPAIIKVVQIGVVAAWAYVESILDVRALLAGNKVALIKSEEQWTTRLGNLGNALLGETKTQDCSNGLSYQDYLKCFLFAMGGEKLAYRMMDVMEQNIRLTPAYQNCRMDYMLCRMDYDTVYAAEPLFARLSVLGEAGLCDFRIEIKKSFSYY